MQMPAHASVEDEYWAPGKASQEGAQEYLCAVRRCGAGNFCLLRAKHCSARVEVGDNGVHQPGAVRSTRWPASSLCELYMSSVSANHLQSKPQRCAPWNARRATGNLQQYGQEPCVMRSTFAPGHLCRNARSEQTTPKACFPRDGKHVSMAVQRGYAHQPCTVASILTICAGDLLADAARAL